METATPADQSKSMSKEQEHEEGNEDEEDLPPFIN